MGDGLGGGVAEFNASGMPRETFWPGDLTFPLAPSRSHVNNHGHQAQTAASTLFPPLGWEGRVGEVRSKNIGGTVTWLFPRYQPPRAPLVLPPPRKPRVECFRVEGEQGARGPRRGRLWGEIQVPGLERLPRYP